MGLIIAVIVFGTYVKKGVWGLRPQEGVKGQNFKGDADRREML
jgi:hypothetical protein